MAISVVLTTAAALAIATPVGAASRARVSPISAGVLTAQAVHNGTVTPARGQSNPGNPTLFPNVRASNLGSQPANETPVATDPNNDDRLLTGSNDYNCGSVQGFYTSDDGGFHWPHQHCMSTVGGLSGFGDPATAYDTSGNAYIMGIDATGSLTNGQIVYQKSADNGVTWSATAKAVGATFVNGLTDKEWLEADHSASSPFAGCLYLSITQFDSTLSNTEISVSHSCDGAATWTTTFAGPFNNYPAIDQFSDIGIAADGTVYTTWMHCVANGPAGDCGGTTATFMIAKSTDGGNTWSAPTQVGSAKLAPDSCFCAFYGNVPNTLERVSNIPVVDVDRSSSPHAGRVASTFYDDASGHMQVKLTWSDNGGVTWHAPLVVSNITHDQWFQWVSFNDANGMMAVTWWDRRADPANFKYAPWVAIVKSGTPSAHKSVALSNVLSDPSKDGFGGGFFGDYSSSAWTHVALQLQYCSTLFTTTCQNTWTGVDFGP